MRRNVTLAQRLYSVLLHAYPARFRREFGGEMLQAFADQLGDARAWGGRARLYVRTFVDWLRSVPAEHLAEHEHRRRAEDTGMTPAHRLLLRGLVFAPSPSAAIWIAAGVLAWVGLREVNRGFRGRG
jgi:hypothetical protein